MNRWQPTKVVVDGGPGRGTPPDPRLGEGADVEGGGIGKRNHYNAGVRLCGAEEPISLTMQAIQSIR